jgi:SAM-dependent methyltransferase
MKICLLCSSELSSASWECANCRWSAQHIDNVVSFSSNTTDFTKGYDPVWYEQLFHLETNNFWFLARNRLIQLLVKRHLPKNGSYLEVGCGTGFVLTMLEKTLQEWKIFATETQLEGIKFACKRVSSNVKFFQMDACAIPFRNEFKAIGAYDVIEHIFDDETAIANIYAALEPGGYFLLSVPQHMFLWSKYDEVGFHFRRYSAIELKEKLKAAGFGVVASTSFNSLLLPIVLFSRVLTNRKTKHQVDVLDELRLPVILNYFLSAVLFVEYMLIRMGVRFPFGSSLVIIAKKLNK